MAGVLQHWQGGASSASRPPEPPAVLPGLQEELDRIDELERILDSFGSSSSFDSEGEVQFEGEASAAPGIFCPFQKSFQCNTVPVGVRMPIPLGACPPDLMLPWQQVVTAEVSSSPCGTPGAGAAAPRGGPVPVVGRWLLLTARDHV